MNEHLLDLVERQLQAFKARGGDDLVAVYVEDEDVPEDSAVELVRRGDGRKHVVSVGDEINRYTIQAWEFRTEEVHGIRCTVRDAMDDGGKFSSRVPMARFAQRLALLLDRYRGQFEPIREPGVALHENSKIILGIIKDALPRDGSWSVQCNAVPDMDDDSFTFHAADGTKSDIWVRTGNGQAVLYCGYSKDEVFWRKDDFAGLKEAVEAGLSSDLGMAP